MNVAYSWELYCWLDIFDISVVLGRLDLSIGWMDGLGQYLEDGNVCR